MRLRRGRWSRRAAPTSPEQFPAFVDAVLTEGRVDEALTACESVLEEFSDAWNLIMPQVAAVHEAAVRPAGAAHPGAIAPCGGSSA